jgi:hypothetical protein
LKVMAPDADGRMAKVQVLMKCVCVQLIYHFPIILVL